MRIDDFIVCDDIRREIGNKFTLVGVYGESIDFEVSKSECGKWPKNVKLGFFIRIRFDNNETIPDKFSMHALFDDTDEQILGQLNIESKKPRQNKLNIAIVHGRFAIPKESTLSFILRLYEGDNQIEELVLPIRIKINERIRSQP